MIIKRISDLNIGNAFVCWLRSTQWYDQQCGFVAMLVQEAGNTPTPLSHKYISVMKFENVTFFKKN